MSILKGVYTVCLIYFLYTLIFGLAFFLRSWIYVAQASLKGAEIAGLHTQSQLTTVLWRAGEDIKY